MNEWLGIPHIVTPICCCLTAYANNVAKLWLGYPVNDVADVLELATFDAGKLNSSRGKPLARRSGGADSQHEGVPVLGAEVGMELDCEGRRLHECLTPELSRAEGVGLNDLLGHGGLSLAFYPPWP